MLFAIKMHRRKRNLIKIKLSMKEIEIVELKIDFVKEMFKEI